MKKYCFLFFLSLVCICSCETDDFCMKNPVTPQLIINFKDYKGLNKLKKRDSLSVWAVKKDSLYKNQLLDSIVIPLNTEDNSTTYLLAISKDSLSSITFKYNTAEEYVSRSCGYRIVFNDIVISENKYQNSWIDSISVKQLPNINKQNNAHITIYH